MQAAVRDFIRRSNDAMARPLFAPPQLAAAAIFDVGSCGRDRSGYRDQARERMTQLLHLVFHMSLADPT